MIHTLRNVADQWWWFIACRKDIPQRRVRRWSFSIQELIKDAAGREHFMHFLEKEFSAENLKLVPLCALSSQS